MHTHMHTGLKNNVVVFSGVSRTCTTFKASVVRLCVEQKMQDMDERRIRRLAGGYCQFSDIEKNVLPIITKCLDGISAAGMKINEKQVRARCFMCVILSHGIEIRGVLVVCLSAVISKTLIFVSSNTNRSDAK